MEGVIFVHAVRSRRGAIPESVRQAVRRELERQTGLAVDSGKELPLPDEALEEVRNQYRAGEFLNRMKRIFRNGGGIHLAVTDVDLFAPGLNFVFGAASASVAVFSIARLDPGFHGERRSSFLTATRAAKEAVHEVGHVLGLEHCGEAECVMWSSSTLKDTDLKGPGFCERHAYEVMRAVNAA